jgi:hypothetical protein
MARQKANATSVVSIEIRTFDLLRILAQNKLAIQFLSEDELKRWLFENENMIQQFVLERVEDSLLNSPLGRRAGYVTPEEMGVEKVIAASASATPETSMEPAPAAAAAAAATPEEEDTFDFPPPVGGKEKGKK